MLAFRLCLSIAPWPAVTGTIQAGITIDLGRGTEREKQTKQTLEQVLAMYDLKKYTFTRRVIIEEGAINHAFPALTLNARFAAAPDELLTSYVHEQLHWHLRDRLPQQQAAIAELRKIYATVLRDERQIAAVVDRHGLRVK
jgi:hypothetical protein